MNIAVCDDLPEYREKLKELLTPYIASNNLDIAEFSRGEDLLVSCEEGKSWDIVFLDIEMDGLSGIETGKRLRKLQRDIIIIFVTSHISYVSDAFRQDAFQFLLKPVRDADFRKDFERALRVWKNRRRRYLIKWRNTSNMLEYRSILYLEAYHRHVFVHTSDEDYECVGKLQEEYAKLRPFGFAQCHQGFIVNMSRVVSITKSSVKLDNGTEVPVSRRHYTNLMSDFNLYMAGKLI